jgi:hypothetical protein
MACNEVRKEVAARSVDVAKVKKRPKLVTVTCVRDMIKSRSI